MESTFQRPGPLKLDASNLEEEWKFFIQKYNLFVLASGSANKTEQVRLAMLLNFVGDDARKLLSEVVAGSDAINLTYRNFRSPI